MIVRRKHINGLSESSLQIMKRNIAIMGIAPSDDYRKAIVFYSFIRLSKPTLGNIVTRFHHSLAQGDTYLTGATLHSCREIRRNITAGAHSIAILHPNWLSTLTDIWCSGLFINSNDYINRGTVANMGNR
jgi:hypothetical protein